jgi:hypothetical protein
MFRACEAEHDESQVAHRRICDQLLHVRLHHRDERAVDDADHGEQAEPGGEVERRRGEQREREPQQAVGPHLQQHAGEDHGSRGGRLDVRVRQPGVEGEERHLDRKRDSEGEEHPPFRLPSELDAVEIDQAEARGSPGGRVRPGERDDGDQHEDAAGHRVEDELHRRVDAAVVSPHPDEEVHRDQHGVPEDVEQEQVDRDEHPEHRGLEREHEEGEVAHALVHRLPRRQQRERGEEGGEDEEEEADAVHADEVLDPERRDPGMLLDELVVGARRIEAGPEPQRRGEGGQREQQRDVPHQRLAVLPVSASARQQHDDRPDEGEKNDG